MSYTQLSVSCHCGASNYAFKVITSSLPFKQHLCNCNISRRISGTLLTSYVSIPKTFSLSISSEVIENADPDLSTLTPYHSSKILTRHFCSTCGTHMYLEYHADGHFEAATATLRVINSEYPYIELEDLMWIGATKDGGASPWITHIKKRKLPKYIGESGMSEIWEEPEWHTDEDLPPTQKDNSCEMKPLHAHCHCNGVRFWIAPPTTAASHIPDTPFPDLLVPYWATESSKRSNSDNKPWWLKDSKDRGKRYLAGFCACNSCRRMSGFDLTAWAFIPSTSIFLDEACTVPFTFPTGPASPNTSPDPRTLNLKAYESSTGVLRSFCSTCGAKVFWDGRAGSGKERVVDVAVGLLDAPSGARAEEILSWHLGRVSFKEEAANMLLVTSLEEGMQACSERLTES